MQSQPSSGVSLKPLIDVTSQWQFVLAICSLLIGGCKKLLEATTTAPATQGRIQGGGGPGGTPKLHKEEKNVARKNVAF